MFNSINERLTNIGNVFKQIGDIISNIGSIIASVFNFIIEAIRFIIFAVKTIFNNLVQVFDSIFVDGFWNTIDNGFSNLTTYIGGLWTTTLGVLITIAFAMIIYSFVMRLIKGQINYNSAVKQLDKQTKHKK